ncbi:MAG: hypothetical protein H0U74_23900 [Bradymonadaceae bacterium]|nr:hypothetical protein [Lujinxingiaceae bacterium]
MAMLTERMKEVDRKVLVADSAKLIDEEVAHKSGLSGLALKGGYKVVKTIKPGFIEEAIDHLLDQFSEALSPLYEDYVAQESVNSFEHYIKRHDSRAANDLLSITDERAKRSDNKVLKSTYQKLRGQAEKHVLEALPGLGRLIDQHAPKS